MDLSILRRPARRGISCVMMCDYLMSIILLSARNAGYGGRVFEKVAAPKLMGFIGWLCFIGATYPIWILRPSDAVVVHCDNVRLFAGAERSEIWQIILPANLRRT